MISADVRRFVAQHIETPDQLDILLFLHGHAERGWSALEVSQAVYTVPAAATVRLEQFVAEGWAVSDGAADPRYSYRPASEDKRRQVQHLAEAYAVDRVGVIKLIFTRTAEPAQDLADAFRLRGRNT